ncbi:MAG TPA: tetratricopeptide repeat protein, partial [Rhodanobacter sp.]
AAGVQVSVLGVGTPQGGPVPLPDGGFLRDAQDHLVLARREDGALAALAAAGGGRYVTMSADHADIDALHAQLRAGPVAKASGQTSDEWQDRGPWLLLPLLLVVALAFRRGWLLLLPLLLLPMLPATAEATSWHDLWQRPDQQAAQALRHGDAKQAQQLAADPAWRGAAAYRAGDYAAAAQALQHAPGGDAMYNLGNALARQHQYQQAIDAYDRALKLDPTNADATANRKAVEDWLRRQQKKPSSQDQQKQHDKGGGKGQSSPDGKAADGKPDSQQSQDEKSAQDKAKASAQAGQAGQPEKPNQASQDAAQDKPGDQPKPLSPQQQAAQNAQAVQAQKALQQQMDQALASPHKDQQAPTHQLGTMSKDDPQSKLPLDLQHALQRVPDDPGALLRRKFELEYQQRHGGAPSEGDQP